MYTYIIESNGLYKIGKTTDVEKRMTSYRTHTATHRIVIVYDGDYEKYLHDMFQMQHSHLEWYKLSQENIDAIDLPIVEREEQIIISKELLDILEKGLTQAESSIYAYMIRNMDNINQIGISKQMRINIGKKLELNERTVLNTLGMLTSKKLLYTTSKGIYKINPRYAYKGSTINRNKDLKFVLEVECPDC